MFPDIVRQEEKGERDRNMTDLISPGLTEPCPGMLLDIVGQEQEVVRGQVQPHGHDGLSLVVQHVELIPQF